MVSLKLKNTKLREFCSEFIGTLTLVCIGCSGNVVLALRQTESDFVAGPLIWGLAVTVAIFVSGGVSGGHLNPAVTLGLATVGKFNWKNVAHYWAGQYLGSFFGSLLTYIVYRENLIRHNRNETLAAFGTQMQQENITLGTALVDQIVATAFFLLIVNAITDERNMSVSKGLIPIGIGFANIGVLAFAFGYNCGGPMNPARDLSPRIVSLMTGWNDAFTYGRYIYFWVPIVACHIGAIVGCWVYRLFIENHWPQAHSYDLSSMAIPDPTNIEIPMTSTQRNGADIQVLKFKH